MGCTYIPSHTKHTAKLCAYTTHSHRRWRVGSIYAPNSVAIWSLLYGKYVHTYGGDFYLPSLCKLSPFGLSVVGGWDVGFTFILVCCVRSSLCTSIMHAHISPTSIVFWWFSSKKYPLWALRALKKYPLLEDLGQIISHPSYLFLFILVCCTLYTLSLHAGWAHIGDGCMCCILCVVRTIFMDGWYSLFLFLTHQINLGSTHVFQRVVLLKRINLGSTHVFQRVVLLLPYV